jgi:membrane-associated protease RseP (regulator of RpoE activity)
MVEVLIVLLLMHVAIALHELGHYVVYRKYRVPVLGVYLGGPPWVLRWKRKGTEYRLGLIPLFGAVLVREDDAKHLNPPDWVRVYLAGPLASLLAALVGFVLWGILKGNLFFTLKALAAVLIFPVLLVGDFFRALFGDLSTAGAIPMFQVTGSVIRRGGLEGLALVWGALNAVLFWFNLLPIPPLDGGQAVYRLFAGRRWVEKVYPYAMGFGLAVLFALMEIALLKDVARLLGR